MSAALARMLPEFPSASGRTHAFDGLRQAETAPMPDFDFSVQQPVVDHGPDIGEVRAEAFAEGQEAARQALSAKFAAERQALEDAHKEALAQQARLLGEQAVLAMEEAARNAAARAASEISDHVARLMAPFLEEAMRSRMIDALSAEVQAVCSLDGMAGLHMRGPAPLLEVVKGRLEGKVEMTFEAAEGVDLTIQTGQTEMRPRFDAWARVLTGALS